MVEASSLGLAEPDDLDAGLVELRALPAAHARSAVCREDVGDLVRRRGCPRGAGRRGGLSGSSSRASRGASGCPGRRACRKRHGGRALRSPQSTPALVVTTSLNPNSLKRALISACTSSKRVDSGGNTSRVPGVVANFLGVSRSIREAILTDGPGFERSTTLAVRLQREG